MNILDPAGLAPAVKKVEEGERNAYPPPMFASTGARPAGGTVRYVLSEQPNEEEGGKAQPMNILPTIKSVCAPSDDVVAREIEGEMILVPLTAGVGDTDAELYTLNETGKSIWRRLDGKATLAEIADSLAAEFDAPASGIATDVLGLANELAKRGMLTVHDI